jgi:hypothetical protein
MKNDRHNGTALVTIERIMLKRANLVMRAGESEKGWEGW